MVWQWLIRGWLAGAAKQELYAAAEEMLRERLRRQPTDAPAGESEKALPPPCDVGLVFSTAAEAAGVGDRLTDSLLVHGAGFDVRLGQFGGRHVAVVHAGPGWDNAARGTEALLLGHHPRIVIAAGFADALAAGVGRGHVVLASHILTQDAGGGVGDVTELPTALAEIGGAIASRPGVHVGRVVTLAGKLRGGAEREALGRRLNALIAEPSAGAVAQACQRQGVPVFAVHAVRHALGQEVSAELRHLKRQESLAGKLGAVLGAVTRRPSTVKEMWQSAEDTLVAGDRLAEVLAELVGLLPVGSRQ